MSDDTVPDAPERWARPRGEGNDHDAENAAQSLSLHDKLMTKYGIWCVWGVCLLTGDQSVAAGHPPAGVDES